ncbi:hypothetical protein HDV64DRAFT_161945 [Trichoderma sp. TUCIM 5745]
MHRALHTIDDMYADYVIGKPASLMLILVLMMRIRFGQRVTTCSAERLFFSEPSHLTTPCLQPRFACPMSILLVSFFLVGCAIFGLSCCLVTTQASSICKRGEIGGGEEKREPEVTLSNHRLPFLLWA